jgi:hypothetical protein
MDQTAEIEIAKTLASMRAEKTKNYESFCKFVFDGNFTIYFGV